MRHPGTHALTLVGPSAAASQDLLARLEGDSLRLLVAVGRDGPVRPLAWIVGLARALDKVLVERKVVANGVLSS